MSEVLPDIHLFNPTCEYAVANGNPNWQPNRILQKMERDLSSLPMFFAKKEDYILVDTLPSVDFISCLQQFDIDVPNFILKNDAFNNRDFLLVPKNRLVPWGWSPAAHKLLSSLKNSCSDEFRHSPVFDWKTQHREITSRAFAMGILKKLQQSVNSDAILPQELTPKICFTQNDFEDAIQQWGNIMIKAPWSSSGRGLQPVTKTPVHPKVWEKIMAIVKEQGYAIAEPYLEKKLDIAFLFEFKNRKADFLGISNFSTNKKGQYEGNYLNGMPASMDKRLVEFSNTVVHKIFEPIVDAIESSDMAIYYEGFFGIDMLIYSDANNELKINPCLEINVRQTMGLLAHRLEKLLNPDKKGMYRVYYQPGTSFNQFANIMMKKHPLKMKGNKIDSGFLALTEPVKESSFGAYIII